MAVAFLILGIILFVGLVVVHEWGHFIFARRNGVTVEEFGIGFPPKIWSKKVKSKKGDFIFSVNWIFLGGFVRLKGEHDSDTEPGTFGAASIAAKTKIMAAGVGMNFLAALVIFTAVAWIGMPKLIDNQFTVASDTKVIRDVTNKGVVTIGVVDSASPAAKAGLQKGDRLVSVGDTKIDTPTKLLATTKRLAGKTVPVVTENKGQRKTTTVTLRTTSPYLGVGSQSGEEGFEVRRSTWSAPIVAIGVGRDFTIATVKGVGTAFKGLGSIIAGVVTGNGQARTNGQTAASDQLSGPVGIFAIVYHYASQGIGFVLFIIGLISLSLAVMNILPIPALDGGKLFITYMSRLFGKRVSENFENYAYGISFMMLIGLMVIITVLDVRRFF
jgi:regulator of sigma E protease